MADAINLSDVSTKDDSKLKTGGRRRYNMPKSCPEGQRLITRGKESKCVKKTKTPKQQIAENEKKGFAGNPKLQADWKEYKEKGYLERKKKGK